MKGRDRYDFVKPSILVLSSRYLSGQVGEKNNSNRIMAFHSNIIAQVIFGVKVVKILAA